MATIHVLDEPFIDADFQYIYYTQNWNFDNAEITKSNEIEYKKDVYRNDPDNPAGYTIPHSHGKTLNAGQSVTLNNPLTVRFKNGIQSLEDGKLYDISFQFTSMEFKNTSDSTAFVHGIDFMPWGSFTLNAECVLNSGAITWSGYIKFTYNIIRHGGPDGKIPVSVGDLDQPIEFWTPQSNTGITDLYVYTNSWITWAGKTINTANRGATQTVTLPTLFKNDYDTHGGDSDDWPTTVIGVQKATSGTYVMELRDCGSGLSGAAVPTITISYNTLGGSIVQSTLKAKRKSVKITSTIPTKNSSDNTRFLGWSKTEGGSVVYKGGDTYDTDENLTLYALWEYRVRYQGNDGTIYDGNGDSHNSPYDVWKLHDQSITVNFTFEYNIGVADDKDFDYWSGSDGNLYKIDNAGNEPIYTTNSPLTLTPVFNTPMYTVRFYRTSAKTPGELLAEYTDIKRGSTVAAPTVDNPDGTFAGWSSDAYRTGITGNMNIYGIWQRGYVWYKSSSGQWVVYQPKE